MSGNGGVIGVYGAGNGIGGGSGAHGFVGFGPVKQNNGGYSRPPPSQYGNQQGGQQGGAQANGGKK